MNAEQMKLYQRLQAFSLDEPDANLSFSKRLARDNRWTAKYTQRVIDEYKKFAFLAVVAGHPMTPSDQVDQAWHLHLVYTRSYWGEFCPNVLQTPLHHGPTRGGSREHHKFNDWYSKTLASYESFFGHTPPPDIWPPAHIRFGRDLHFVRVNTQQTWLLPKLHLRLLPKFRLNQPAIVTLLFLLALTITGCEPFRNPLNFTGPEFLRFYLTIASTVIFFASVLRWYLRKPGRNPSPESTSLDPYETAYLVGGQKLAVDAAIASLVQRGYLKPQPESRALVPLIPLPANSHPLEREIEETLQVSEQIDTIRVYAAHATDQISQRLHSLGLLVSQEQAKWAQQLPALGVFLVLLLGISKIGVGIWRGKPVGFLVVLCIITAIIAVCFRQISVFRSRYGDRVLADLKARYANLRTTTTANNQTSDAHLALAFALFGVGVLADGTLTDLRQVLIPPPSSSSSFSGGGCSGGSDGGGGGDCGGGGCGGGGCGGCGGCGGG